jgi:hypothetical protein
VLVKQGHDGTGVRGAGQLPPLPGAGGAMGGAPQPRRVVPTVILIVADQLFNADNEGLAVGEAITSQSADQC